MRRSLGPLFVGLVSLATVAGAEAQAPPAVTRPGAPGQPETPGIRTPEPGSSEEAVPEPLPSPRRQPPPPAPPHIPVAPAAPPSYTITLGARHACVTPAARWHARAEGGYIDVQQASPNAMAVNLTGTAAANSHLGGSSSASETFQLVQEFEITCSDPAVQSVVLTLDSALVGFVRSKHKAGACMRLADACVRPASWDNSPLTVVHPPLCVSGTQGRLCNQHLPPVEGPPMPLGRYVLVANFVIDASAGGICDAHAVADFSPDTTLPADWVRMRDPFQGVAKKAFGYYLNLTAAAPTGAGPVVARRPKPSPIQQVKYTPLPAPKTAAPPRRPVVLKPGL